MKKFVFIFLVFVVSHSFAQQPPQNNVIANVQGLKIAYFTRQLNITGDETQKFWPIYFSYVDELKAVRKENQNNQLAMDEAILAVKKKYLTEFQKALGDQRGNRVFTVERDFNQTMRQEMEKRHMRRMNK
jgi:hypothetical protein